MLKISNSTKGILNIFPVMDKTTILRCCSTHSYEEILRRRRSIRNFDEKEIPEVIEYTKFIQLFFLNRNKQDLLVKVLKEAQTAPSSFNLQPYKVIVVRSKLQRIALSTAMIGLNQERVKFAPVSIVILAGTFSFYYIIKK